jgi:hypothetical protein
MPDATTTVPALGRRFVEALATRDPEALGAVLHPEIDFRALTPNRFWEAHDRGAVLEIVLGDWFPPHEALDELLLLDTDAVADREQVRFRFRERTSEGPMIVEQQAYLTERDGLIDWIRIVCSGKRPPT